MDAPLRMHPAPDSVRCPWLSRQARCMKPRSPVAQAPQAPYARVEHLVGTLGGAPRLRMFLTTLYFSRSRKRARRTFCLDLTMPCLSLCPTGMPMGILQQIRLLRVALVFFFGMSQYKLGPALTILWRSPLVFRRLVRVPHPLHGVCRLLLLGSAFLRRCQLVFHRLVWAPPSFGGALVLGNQCLYGRCRCSRFST